MNSAIINNLFEFWTQVGKSNACYREEPNYEVVSVTGSDWPNRVFDVDSELVNQDLIFRMKSEELPANLTLKDPINKEKLVGLDFGFDQKNMALNYDSYLEPEIVEPCIKEATSKEQLAQFAQTASQSFGYTVDPEIVFKTQQNTQGVFFYLYESNGRSLGCGILYMDSNQLAGLHMIGTLKEGRGQGIGKKMTQFLLQKGKSEGAKIAVLQASAMGENIYRRLGFETFGGLQTYRVPK